MLPSIPVLEEREESRLVGGKLDRKKMELEQLERKIRVMYGILYNSNVGEDSIGVTNESRRAG